MEWFNPVNLISWRSDTRANVALIVSVISLLISGATFVLNAFLDRPRVKVSSALWDDEDGNPYKIGVTVVNKGRRPVVLTMLGGTCRKGGGSGVYFDSDKKGIQLGENEQHQFEIDKEGVVAIDRYGGPDERYDFMWVQDTLGNRHKIPNSHEYIQRMYP